MVKASHFLATAAVTAEALSVVGPITLQTKIQKPSAFRDRRLASMAYVPASVVPRPSAARRPPPLGRLKREHKARHFDEQDPGANQHRGPTGRIPTTGPPDNGRVRCAH